MKRFALFSVGLALLAAGCSDIRQEPLAPSSDGAQLARSGATMQRQATIMQKSAGMGVMSEVSPTSLAVQELNGLTPEDLAQFLAGPGVTVSNVSYTGVNRAAGTFSGGTGIIGFEEGIILSTGCISNVIGPNSSPGITCINNTPGDPDLDELSGQTTFDAAVLEFDFVPEGDRVFFQYVFSSDEYNEFVGSQFNDAFGFFINGVNFAEVGDPPVPITINTINRGQAGVMPTNPNLFRNNDPFTATFFGEICPPGGCFDTEMDGVTVVLTLEAPVNPGVTNRMKLAIADGADRVLDSNVFIQAGTLAVCPNPVDLNEVFSNGGPDGTISLSSTTTTVGIHNIAPFLPVGPLPPQASWVTFGPTPQDGTPAQTFTVGDFNTDGGPDVRVSWSTSQLVADGRISEETEEITIWGTNENTGDLFCGTRQVTVIP